MIGKLLTKWRICLCVVLIGFSGGAQAGFHLWVINEIYSNASGTIQFIELVDPTGFGGQQFLASHNIKSSNGVTTNNFTFLNNLPGDTLGKKFLIGSTGFQALGIVAPDYVMPNGFLFQPNGTLLFSDIYDNVSYTGLPTDGSLSLNRIGTSGSNFSTGTNSPTNFAGITGTIPPPATVPGAPTIGTATAGNGQVSITFTPPGNNGGATITGYSATCGASITPGPNSPIVVMGLTNGVAVTCTVRATNSVGTGNPSGISNSVTPIGPPGVPTNVTATPGDSQVTMNFSAPGSDGGSAIIDYTANCGGQIKSGPTSPLTVLGLTNGVTVTCTVFATNAQGNGAPSTGINVTPVAAPGAPTMGTAIPGNLEAFISFTPPVNNGGSAITGYTATCNPGPLSAIGMDSPITVGGLTNNQLYSCSVTASNSIGTSAASATADVTPDLDPLLMLVKVNSRKTHTGFGSFDLKIETSVAIGGTVSVEPRSSASHTIVFVFNKPVSSVSGAGVTPIGTASPASPSGKELPVILTGVPDQQRVTVSLTNVNGGGVNVNASMGFLVGDVSNSRSVNASDISSVKARQGLTVDQANFRFDLTTSGAIDQADVSAVKARSGVVLP